MPPQVHCSPTPMGTGMTVWVSMLPPAVESWKTLLPWAA
jgi:hypothetical protein